MGFSFYLLHLAVFIGIMKVLITRGYAMGKIIKNAIQCKKCGDIIESKSVHDFVTCSCGACSVDGGHEYLRRCGNMEDIIELSEIMPNEETSDGDN